jgi:hypothetical protein
MSTAFLVNGVQRSEMSAAFEIPPHTERANIAPGDFAHLAVEFPPTPEGCGGERFWVRVLSNTNGRYVGKIYNQLLCPDIHGLGLGDNVAFHAAHVLDTWEDEAK